METKKLKTTLKNSHLGPETKAKIITYLLKNYDNKAFDFISNYEFEKKGGYYSFVSSKKKQFLNVDFGQVK